jgi:SAM-dependent methyltransferase
MARRTESKVTEKKNASKGGRTEHRDVADDSRYEWWRETYEGARPEDLPWFSPSPDKDFLTALDRYAPNRGKALDLGCGPGTHSVELAKRGWRVTAVDVAPGAISMAARFAARAGASIEFVNTDVLTFEPEKGGFDLVHDRGFLHTLPPSDWHRWRELVGRALRPAGLVIAKEFVFDTKRTFGPRGLTQAEIRGVFSPGLHIEAITRSSFSGRGAGQPAFLVIARRR